ncbi:unnamed protein product [Fraxinus pennsylvanica]|uniref:DUF4283 domain-containing protein n=1 Tax=Fraxinus pennsylvanica TaxID=56036 RepID=A0AAD2E3F7_9LAMI|nr:unnamed protein product [Fraxinus pennsylvanica]
MRSHFLLLLLRPSLHSPYLQSSLPYLLHPLPNLMRQGLAVLGPILLLIKRKPLRLLSLMSFLPLSMGKKLCPMTSIQPEIEPWKNAVVGFVLGVSPSFQNMLKFVHKHWQSVSLPKIYTWRDGILFFDFPGKRAYFELWPFFSFDSKPMILTPWSQNLAVDRLGVAKVPVLIRLPGLQLK